MSGSTRQLADALSKATESAYGTAKLAPNGSTTSGLAVQGNDSRLTAAADLAAHLSDPTAAHAAQAIVVTTSSDLAGTDVQAALEELATKSYTSADITDFTEASQDVTGALIAAAGGTYNDAAGTITLPSASTDTEAVQDIVGALIVGAGGTYNDAAGTIALPAASTDTEAVQDIVGALIVGAGGSYNDSAGTITLPSSSGGFANPMTARGDVITGSPLAGAYTNQALAGAGATFSMSDGASATSAFDNNDGTQVVCGTTSNGWFRADLGSAKAIAGYRYLNASGGIFSASSYVIESSADDSAWTIRHTVTGINPAVAYDSGQASLPGGPFTARYWRVRATGGTPSGFRANSVEFLTLVGTAAGTAQRLGLGTQGYALVSDGTDVVWEPLYATLAFVIDGGGTALATGIKGDLPVYDDCTIVSATALADQSGSVVVDLWRDTFANFPPVDADSITSSAPVTISGATKSQDTALTGWSLNLSAGDILRYNVDSATTIQRVTIALRVRRR